MRPGVVRYQSYRFACAEVVALAEDRGDLGAVEFGEHLRVRASGLDYRDLGGQALACSTEREVLGARPEDPLLAFRGVAPNRQRHAHALAHLDLAAAHAARQEIHRRRADEARHEE